MAWDNTANAEDVIGPTGAQLWTINASVDKIGVKDRVIDTFQVRAVSYDGALLLAREMRLDIVDAEAVKA